MYNTACICLIWVLLMEVHKSNPVHSYIVSCLLFSNLEERCI
jgi:hypothetical protein